MKKQTAKVGVAGSFFNQLMGNNSSFPVVGQGATIMHYTDRSVAEVVEVSPDGNEVKIEHLQAIHDKTKAGGHGHQNWLFQPTGRFETLVWKNGVWKIKSEKIVYTKEILQKMEEAKAWSVTDIISAEQKENLLDEFCELRLVDGITKKKTVYTKVSIIFGVRDYHYDWSF